MSTGNFPFLLSALLIPACIGAKIGDGESATATFHPDGAPVGFQLDTLVDTTITVVPDAEAELVLRCDRNLIDDFVVEVRDGILVLDTRSGIALLPQTDCTAEVTLPLLESLAAHGSGRVALPDGAEGLADVVLSGSGAVEIGPVAARSIDIDVSGSGRLTIDGLAVGDLFSRSSGSGATLLTGTADSADIGLSGSGRFGETGLVVKNLVLDCSGSGSAELTATDSAVVDLSGSGSVTIHGSPQQRDTTDTGSGSIHFE